MNILEIEDIIKGLPDQSLIQEAQAPSGQVPQFLVVSEIQRRADMRKRFQNQQQETPQGTIAQQIVQGGIASMGNQQPIQPMPQQGMQPQGMPPMPPQGMPPAMQQQPPMSPPMSPPMQPPMMPPQGMAPQGMAAGGVVRMREGELVPYTGGTENYRNLIDRALMAGGTSSDIEALIGGNPEAQAVYNSMRGPSPEVASIPYGEEFYERSAVVGGSPGYTPYYIRSSDEARRKKLLENIEYNQKQQEIISGRNPEADYIPAYLSNFASMPDTQGATSDSIRSQNQRQQNKFDQISNQTDRESIFDIERFSRMMEMNSPNYSLVGSGLGFNSQENLINRNENAPAQQARSPSIGSSVLTDKLAEVLAEVPEETDLEKFYKMGDENRRKNELIKEQTRRDSPFQGTGPKNLFEDKTGLPPLTTDGQGSATEIMSTGEMPSIDSLLQYKSPLSFGDNYNIENPLDMDSKRFYETTINKDPKDLAPIISLGLSDKTPKDKDAEDLMKRPQGPDYSAAASILDQLQAVDYSAFKPDYAGLITEQERRAQKIRDDASKDASAQALIQLGAGLAAGDISKGLSAAGQSVADIKRQARAEAREEEGLARKLQLAQDEAGMQLGLKQAEAERSIQLQRAGMAKDEADARSKAEVGAYEFEKTFGLSENKLLAEIMTELDRSERASLSAAIEQWKSLSDAVTEEDVATRNALRSKINSMLGNLEQSRGQLRSQFNIGSAAVPKPQGSSVGFNLIGTRPGQ